MSQTQRDDAIDQMREIATLKAEVERLQERVIKLTGHLDWVGWSSDGVAKARAEVERLQSANDGQKQAIINQGKTIYTLRAERKELLAACKAAIEVLPDFLIDPTCSLEAQASSEVERDEMAAVHCLRRAIAKAEATP